MGQRGPQGTRHLADGPEHNGPATDAEVALDADGDGHPGVTSRVSFGDISHEIYLARREIFSYDLTGENPDRLVGTVTDRSEQLVLGASDPSMVAPVNWTQLDDPARNPVIWRRVDPSWDGARLAAERDALFPPNPTIDW